MVYTPGEGPVASIRVSNQIDATFLSRALPELVTDLEDATKENVKLRSVLEHCARRFREYVKLHLEKDPPAERKATSNRHMAERCEEVLVLTKESGDVRRNEQC